MSTYLGPQRSRSRELVMQRFKGLSWMGDRAWRLPNLRRSWSTGWHGSWSPGTRVVCTSGKPSGDFYHLASFRSSGASSSGAPFLWWGHVASVEGRPPSVSSTPIQGGVLCPSCLWSSILEREVILGFPAGYTEQCVAKSDRKFEWLLTFGKPCWATGSGTLC